MTAVMLLSLCACGTPQKADGTYTVGIVQLMQHVALDQATKFVNDGVDLIMGNATSAVIAAKEATSTIPIIGTSGSDEVDDKLVLS